MGIQEAGQGGIVFIQVETEIKIQPFQIASAETG
jgi:hypothetical protein